MPSEYVPAGRDSDFWLLKVNPEIAALPSAHTSTVTPGTPWITVSAASPVCACAAPDAVRTPPAATAAVIAAVIAEAPSNRAVKARIANLLGWGSHRSEPSGGDSRGNGGRMHRGVNRDLPGRKPQGL